MSMIEELAPHFRPARVLRPTSPTAVSLAVPEGYSLVALVPGSDELGLSGDRALAILTQTRPEPRFSAAVHRARLTAPGENPEGRFAVWELPASAHAPAVFAVEDGGALLFPDSDAPPAYRGLDLSTRFVDLALEPLFEQVDEAFDAYERGELTELSAPLLDGANLDEAAARAEKLRYGSRLGGLPVHGAEGAALPEGQWRYALHLGGDILDVTFGDAGSLHLWLGDGEALLMGDSA